MTSAKRDPATLGMAILVGGMLMLAAGTVSLLGVSDRLSRPREHAIGSFLELESLYDSLDYRLPTENVEDVDVPRAYLDELSGRWATEVNTLPVPRKKNLFFRTVLPLVLRSNELIEQDRERAVEILEAQDRETVSSRDLEWLRGLAERYDALDDSGKVDRQRLLRRVDVIPVSLALGQSAYESGWGTSRFTGEANALYGQWTWSDKGVKPRKQRKGMGDYRIARFDSPLDSVRAYAQNLNTHRAYREFRRSRAALRAAGKPIRGLTLADALTRYSERGAAYVKTLKQMMRANHLTRLEDARLRNHERPLRIVPEQT